MERPGWPISACCFGGVCCSPSLRPACVGSEILLDLAEASVDYCSFSLKQLAGEFANHLGEQQRNVDIKVPCQIPAHSEFSCSTLPQGAAASRSRLKGGSRGEADRPDSWGIIKWGVRLHPIHPVELSRVCTPGSSQ